MTGKKPTYEELLKENLNLKLQLTIANNENKLLEDLKIKNAMLEEMNEELTQTFDQLKHSEIELAKVEKLYKMVSSNISDVIWMIDLTDKFLFISPSAQKLYGYTPKEIEKLTVKDVLTEDSYAKHIQALSLRIEKENKGEITGGVTHIYKQKKKNGEIIWTEIIADPLRDENNRIHSILGVTRDITGRVLVEEKMKKLSVAVEQNPASIVITGIDGTIEYVNSTFTQTTGYEFEELEGKDPKILKSGLTHKTTYQKLWETIMAGKIWRGEFINKKKNGEIFYEHATIAPIMDNDGAITNIVAIKENITSKKFNERELIESKERYQMLSDISLEGILIYENGKIHDVNQSLCQITGFMPDELIGADEITNLFTLESIKDIEEKTKNEITYPFEVAGIRKNMVIYPAELEIRQLKYKERDLKIYALRDISYRKRVEEVLLSSLRLTEMLATHTENEIIDHGLEEAVKLSDSAIGFFHFVNDDQQTVSLHTWTKKTLEHCSIPKITTNYAIADAGTWIDSFHERKPIVHNDYQSLKHKRGLPAGHFPLIRYVSLPVIEDDKVKIIFGVGNKKENYNQFDVDILLLFAKTVWMVIQRKRVEQKLSEANDAKAKFLSLISHDLRSPIGSISSLTEIIIENIEVLSPDEIINFIQVINQTSKTTYDQLENMLTWSKAHSDKIEFSPEIIEIKQVVADFCQSHKYLFDKKNIEIIQQLDSEVKVNVDKNMLNSILHNLLTNAIKFTPKNGKVSITCTDVSLNQVEIAISDNGVGIEPERMHHLFNINSNSSTFGTDKEKGSGLGLLLCKEFIEKNGGKLQVESQLGKGSRFYFTLPVSG